MSATDGPAEPSYLTAEAVWNGHRFLRDVPFRTDGERLHPVDDVPAHARSRHIRLDGTLFPRLTDHHTHLGLTDQHAVLAGGITHAIDLGWVPAEAAGWLADDLSRPSVAIAGSLITCVGGYPVNAGWGPPGSSTEVGGEREARLAVRANVMLGASRIKVTLNTDAGETVDDRVLHAIVSESHAQGCRPPSTCRGPARPPGRSRPAPTSWRTRPSPSASRTISSPSRSAAA
ncbi:hypothetical protein [Leifsonia xyli]|uniref:hypothetical protein n=1 Tax=Leifsonia xyli TaxID=1575 RepID=UPI003D670702